MNESNSPETDSSRRDFLEVASYMKDGKIYKNTL